MKQCCHTKRNFKVPDAEVLPFKTKTYYGDLLLHTSFPKEFNSYM